ncbi:MAG: hypothetical protein WKF59_10395 [Chitinophagaceae bacterium]
MHGFLPKSIANAANLGLAYGIVGGLAYACLLSFFFGRRDWSFIKCGVKGKFESIHQFLRTNYGLDER